MSEAVTASPLRDAAPGAADVIASVRHVVDAELAAQAEAIDQKGRYPAETLRSLGRAGLFSLHLAAHAPAGRRDMAGAIAAMTAVGATCMSTAFCTWCQDASGWYLENTANTALRERLQPAIAAGASFGGTGLSNPMKSLSGIEKFRLQAVRAEGGYVVSGILPWVSNLGDGHWFGTVFVAGDDPAHRIMAMVQCGQPGVEIRRNARFIALEGTGTYAVLFRRAFISDDAILADPLGDMVKRIKPGFILLQTGMALGVTQACIGLMHQANATLAHTNKYLPLQVEHYETEFAAVQDRVWALAATPRETSTDYLRQVLQARLAVSELVLSAGQGALLHNGARGYIDGSPVSRRLRESYFAAIITPSIRHLRQELALMSSH